jgi:hypothetical protein
MEENPIGYPESSFENTWEIADDHGIHFNICMWRQDLLQALAGRRGYARFILLQTLQDFLSASHGICAALVKAAIQIIVTCMKRSQVIELLLCFCVRIHIIFSELSFQPTGLRVCS